MTAARAVGEFRTHDAPELREGGGRPYMLLIYIALHVALLEAIAVGVSLVEWLLVVALLQLRGFCISGGYHRLLAHRSFKTTRTFRFLLACGACTSLRGGPLWWVTHHRHHHLHSDTDADVFTPRQGFWWTYFLWLVSGRFDRTRLEQVRDLKNDRELRLLNRFWLAPSVLLIAIVWLLGGLRGVINVYCLSTVLFLHSLAWIDVLNHLVGLRRYDTGDDSRNSFVLALLCNGEGWHNNHHHYPASASYGFRWWEVDGTYALLRLLSLSGLVWELKTPPRRILDKNLLSNKAMNERRSSAMTESLGEPAVDIGRQPFLHEHH